MSLVDILRHIDALKREFEKMPPLSAEQADKLWQKLRLEWNYNSNHLEGSTLNYSQTQLLLMFDKTTGDHPYRDLQEMKAHDVAISMIRDWASDGKRELTQADVRALHQGLLVEPFEKEAQTPEGEPTKRTIQVGQYKSQSNSVRLKTGDMFHFSTPEETPQMMGDLIDWLRKPGDLHPVIVAAELHYRFVRIHPFDDGNGRMARLLANFVLLRHGYQPLVVKSADKDNYLTALQKADSGDVTAFHEYLANQLVWSQELTLKAVRGDDVEELDDWEKRLKILRDQIQVERKEFHYTKELRRLFWNLNVLPIFKEFENVMSKFDSLFARTMLHIQLFNFADHTRFFESLQLAEDFLKSNEENGFYDLYDITFTKDLNKTLRTGYSYRSSLRITVYNEVFEITHYGDSKAYPLTHILSESEIKQLVSAAANTLAKEIEQAL